MLSGVVFVIEHNNGCGSDLFGEKETSLDQGELPLPRARIDFGMPRRLVILEQDGLCLLVLRLPTA